jgi:dUTP pyrophosphatase
MFNHADEDLQIEPGDRVAQLIIEQISTAPLTEVENLDDTVRGEDGYGSTGR